MKAIILSAGVGNRLRPITDFVPKPLLPIVNRPILDINITRLLKIGIEKIGINLFYKPDIIKKSLEKFSDFVYIVTEDTLRGTGGALLNFQKFISEDFVIHNCDILTDIDFTAAMKFHKFHKAIATLILTKGCCTNFVRIDKDSRIKEFSKNDNEDFYTFTGIAIMSDSIFSYLPDRENFSIIEVYKRIIEDGGTLLGIPSDGIWYDIGSHKKYWKVHHDLFNKEIGLEEMKVNSCFFVDSTSNVQTKNLSGFISIQDHCFIGDRVTLHNAVVFSNSRILKGNFRNCLLSNRFYIKINVMEN